MVLCMSSVLIHMSYFTFYILLSFYSRCYEPRFVGWINTAIIANDLVWGHCLSLALTYSRVSELFWKYEHYGIVYVIDINTHVLLYFLYYFVVLFTLFWNKCRGFNGYSYYCYLFSLGPVFVFDIAIVTCECAVSKLQTLWSCLYHQY